MSTRTSHLFLVLLLVVFGLLVFPRTSHPWWVLNGVDVGVSNQNPMFHQVCPDGEGGVFIARVSSSNVIVDRVDAHGRVLWSGVDVSNASGYHYDPYLVPDGAGGVIVAFVRSAADNADIWRQRIGASGALLWGAAGDSICSVSGNQYTRGIVPDGFGGAVVVWEDNRGTDTDVYAQRINNDGQRRWAAGGVPVCAQAGNQAGIRIVTDTFGGAIIAWQDDRGGAGQWDIYAQRVDAWGSPSWTAGGVAISAAAGSQVYPALAVDEAAGAFVVWEDHRAGDRVYAQRVNHYGVVQWTAGGVAVGAGVSSEHEPRLIADGGSGAILVWEDFRAAQADLYAQRVDGAGARTWTSSGVAICAAAGPQDDPRLVGDGLGGAIVAWADGRAVYSDIYAQRVESGGSTVWGANGTALAREDYIQQLPEIASDGVGGACVVWNDLRGQNSRAYAQRIDRNGYWGYPAGYIASCNDVPGDQGGFVNVAWTASRLDPWPDEAISHYSLWRAIESQAGLLPVGQTPVVDPTEIGRDHVGPAHRVETRGSTTIFWELVATQDAHHLPGYSRTVSTLFDSTAAEGRLHYVQVIAHGTDAAQYWISAPDSGASVDNLAPGAPTGFTGLFRLDPMGIDLRWDAVSVPDLSHYAVYRGLTADFPVGAGTFVTSTADTAFFDAGGVGQRFFYKLVAMDVHGNAGPYALLTPDDVTGVEDTPPPFVDRPASAAPNPFLGASTRIAFSLAEPGEASLRVFDASGRLVRTLAEGGLESGPHEVVWDGRNEGGGRVSGGIYYIRLQTWRRVQTLKLVSIP